ncbi:hypothetical protein EDD21DRAFT_418407 [Dissophora ornata]|nr:F-box and leucine-rich repeat protein 4 [Dissophora ornata]KAI8597750.1 hypothetical protein EDD21DRAFT_418407 [Dissophora ornata]
MNEEDHWSQHQEQCFDQRQDNPTSPGLPNAAQHIDKNAVQFRFKDLPIEIQLQVVQHIPSEQELLQFRLVSSLTNALVLEPVFWHEIAFSKQRCFKIGHASGSRSTSTSLRSKEVSSNPLFYHSSDANVVVHRQSWAASMLALPSRDRSFGGDFMRDGGLVVQPSLTITANLPNNFDSLPMEPFPGKLSMTSHTKKDLSTGLRSWSDIEDSFHAFVTRLSSQERLAHGIHVLTIEDWDGETTMEEMWNTLQTFDALQNLSIRNSILKRLTTISSSRSDVTLLQGISYSSSSWEHITHLDLKDCSQLCDLTGILQLAPCLQDLSLEGCVGLQDFTPLAPPIAPGSIFLQSLPYRKLNLIHTRVHDSELIEILKRSPSLQELRLDQCYELTAASLVAIGFGAKSPGVQEDSGSSEEADMDVDQTLGRSLAKSSTSFCPLLKVLSLKNCYDLADGGVRALAGCRQLELLIIRGLRFVNEDTIEWLQSQGVPLRKALSPLGRWRHWHVESN